MKKRVVTVKRNEQIHLKDPRLAYFKVKIIMNKDFDSNMFKKFVKFFDDLKDDSYWLTNQFNQFNLDEIDEESKSRKKLILVNIDELKKAKHLNIHFIKQNLSAPLSISFFWDALKLHEPDLIHWALDKVQIAKEDSIDKFNREFINWRNILIDKWWIDKLSNFSENNSENCEFVHTVDYLNVGIDNPSIFIPKINSKIIALKIWQFHLLTHNMTKEHTKYVNQIERNYQRNLVEWIRK